MELRAAREAALRIACMATPEERDAALRAVPQELQALVRETVISLRFAPVCWRRRVRAGLPLEQVPDSVRAAMAAIWPGEFQPPEEPG